MSKSSTKQKVTQLKEWLATFKSSPKEPTKSKFSKADHYKNVNNRYGNKKSN
jgi:hypothetical protein